MSPLSNEQKQLLFDYCIGLTSEEQSAKAQTLIATNKQAAEIHSKLLAALEPLESVEPEYCPDELYERTILRISEAADSSQSQLEHLLAVEQTKKVPIKLGFWRNLTEIAAVAASIILIVGVLVPTMGYARQKHWQNKCGKQLSSFFQGLRSYIADHDGKQPSVAVAAGAPYWKIGDQGAENHSNTRRIYRLVQEGYVEPGIFICPGNKASRNLEIEPSMIRTFKDFPDRRYVTYSFRIPCGRTEGGGLFCRSVIMADRNPIFEQLPDDYSKSLMLKLTRDLLTLNSINHNRRGQNVLFGDGCVEFLKKRYNIITKYDDIFTLKDTDVYQGCEVPSHESDIFVAP